MFRMFIRSGGSDWERCPCDPPDLSSWYGDLTALSFIEELAEFGDNQHRDKHPGEHLFPFNSFVARPVSRSEYTGKEDAMNAYWKEWKNLERKRVCRWETLVEWDDVATRARDNGYEINFGYLFGLMVEKGAEYEDGDE